MPIQDDSRGAALRGAERAQYVQEMFSRISHRYDLMNRLMTAGQDARWRAEVIRRAELPPGGRLLDLGTGTGDLCFEALRQRPGCRPVASDFTLAMMRAGQRREGGAALSWAAADSLSLPFPEGIFDAVVTGFMLRNVADVSRALRESLRVLRPGGRIVTLDTTRPPENLLRPFLDIHLNTIIPTLGGWISGEPDAYRYLPESTQGFLSAEQLAGRLAGAGFRGVGFRRLMFGTIAIHWGVK
jgi:demethylmenaquinone methyltransferase/2-methoxy-6-polyprenyl-1,4-benzoquinol methylase